MLRHQSRFGTFRTQYVSAISDETLANQRSPALRAHEALVMPVSILERYKFRAANTCYRFRAGHATFGEQLAEAVGAVRLLVPRREPLTG